MNEDLILQILVSISGWLIFVIAVGIVVGYITIDLFKSAIELVDSLFEKIKSKKKVKVEENGG